MNLKTESRTVTTLKLTYLKKTPKNHTALCYILTISFLSLCQKTELCTTLNMLIYSLVENTAHHEDISSEN